MSRRDSFKTKLRAHAPLAIASCIACTAASLTFAAWMVPNSAVADSDGEINSGMTSAYSPRSTDARQVKGSDRSIGDRVPAGFADSLRNQGAPEVNSGTPGARGAPPPVGFAATDEGSSISNAPAFTGNPASGSTRAAPNAGAPQGR